MERYKPWSLVAKKNYSVIVDNINGNPGSCEIYIKMGNYSEPDIVVEIRSRQYFTQEYELVNK